MTRNDQNKTQNTQTANLSQKALSFVIIIIIGEQIHHFEMLFGYEMEGR